MANTEWDLYDVKIDQNFELSDDSRFYPDSSEKFAKDPYCVEKLRPLFDQVLSCLTNEVSENKIGQKDVSLLLGDGQPMDLFKIFLIVWNRGGYDFISKNGLWVTITKECGLDCSVVDSVNLVYMKYLRVLDRSLRKSLSSERFKNGEQEDGKLGLLLSKMKRYLADPSFDEQYRKKRNREVFEIKQNNNGSDLVDVKIKYGKVERTIRYNDDKNLMAGWLMAKAEWNLYDVKIDQNFEPSDNSSIYLDSSENCVKIEQNNNDADIVDVKIEYGKVERTICDDDEKLYVVEKASHMKKRKRELTSISAMLNWVVEIAKHPDDPTIGKKSEFSSRKDHRREDFWSQALLAREALIRRKCFDSTAEKCILQKQQKMHSSMYEDGNNLSPKVVEKLRSSERVNSVTKPPICPCSNSCSSALKDIVSSPIKAEIKNNSKEQALYEIEDSETNGTDDCSFQRHTPIGPLFQAKVPEWTVMVSESDTKWLGTRMWPLENKIEFSYLENDLIGKGRKDACGCSLPSSVPCVRFHIAENRMRLRRDIGLLFYHWRFHLMGEEVSLSWTIEEEKRFKLMVRSNLPSSNRRFWNDIAKFFPAKTKEKLVSYYLNVFLIGRRAYQNRVTPKCIDSDDEDETEFGCVGGRFGDESSSIGGSNRMVCAENKQYIDF